MAVVAVVARRLFVASIVNRVGNSALNRLGEDLLDLLGDDGGITAVLGMCLGGGLVSLAFSGVDLWVVSFGQDIIYELDVRSRGEPPRDLRELYPGRSLGQRSRQWHGTCPVRTRW